MRRLRAMNLFDLVIAQAIPGFLLCTGWAVMYEIYHEDGSYYTTLMQEILGGEGLFPYFVVSAVLMAFPVGMIIDTVREVVGERWLRIPRSRRGGGGAHRSPLSWMLEVALPPDRLAERYLLYRHAWATLLTPAKAAGNLAVILLIFLVWFVIKIVRMQGWHVYSWLFIVGTPVVGMAIALALVLRYAAGFAEFFRVLHEAIFPAAAPIPPPPPGGGVPPLAFPGESVPRSPDPPR